MFGEDVHCWAQSFLNTLEQAPVPPEHPFRFGDNESQMLLERVQNQERLVLLLDYDGTLVPFAQTPGQAAPDTELLELLAALARRPNTTVHIVSGRDRDTLERWFSGIPIGLHAEHGLWSRLSPAEDWRTVHDIPPQWKDRVLPTLEQFTRRTPGSLIEQKFASLAWHYRFAKSLGPWNIPRKSEHRVFCVKPKPGGINKVVPLNS